MDEQCGQQLEQYCLLTEYIALYIQARLLTVQVARCTQHAAGCCSTGTGRVQGRSQTLHNYDNCLPIYIKITNIWLDDTVS